MPGVGEIRAREKTRTSQLLQLRIRNRRFFNENDSYKEFTITPK